MKEVCNVKSFGESLKRIRESRGMTINQLAMYSGISSASISRYESGERNPPKPENIKKIAEALKFPYEELMEFAGHLENNDEKPKDAVDKMKEYLELNLTDDEIMDRITMVIDGKELSRDDTRRFIAFIRAERAMKKEQSLSGKDKH
jgi:transcriptional regulator with XRE-family HTH domain